MTPAERRRRRVRAALVALALGAVLGCEAAPRAVPPMDEGAAPARLVMTTRFVELTVGDTPVAVPLYTSDSSGALTFVTAPKLTSTDTSVVRVVDNRLVGAGVGRARVLVAHAGEVASLTVAAERRVADDSLRLAAGQVRAWMLVPGWYEIQVVADTSAGSPLELAAPLTCVPTRGGTDRITCHVRDSTRILMKHSGRGGPAAARVRIRQVPNY